MNNWQTILENEFQKDYFKNITTFLETNKDKTIFPEKENIYACFNKTSFDNLKVVILWQDPYHWEWQWNWLSFSVNTGVKLPPSLRNIYKELKSDLWIDLWDNWDLSHWAKNWVLLLNSILTVEKWLPSSHKNIWWETFSDNIIKYINDNKDFIIFILWWNFAINKEKLIDIKKHYIIKSPHPSPFSAHSWFFGSKCFSKCNEILQRNNLTPINWDRH